LPCFRNQREDSLWLRSNTTLPPRLSEGAVAPSYFYSQNKNKNRVVAALHHRHSLLNDSLSISEKKKNMIILSLC